VAFLGPLVNGRSKIHGGWVRGEHEGIAVVERSLAALAKDADEGKIADAKLLTLILALRLRRPDVF
jgi:hypothetical protein